MQYLRICYKFHFIRIIYEYAGCLLKETKYNEAKMWKYHQTPIITNKLFLTYSE